MPKLIQNLTAADIIAQMVTWEQYIMAELGFDKAQSLDVTFEANRLTVSIHAVDKFWEKIDYNERYKLSIWDTQHLNKDWDQLVADVWKELVKCERRPIRELRYSLICLAKVTESDLDIESEVAKGIFAQLYGIKKQLAERLLTYSSAAEQDSAH